MKQYQKEYIGSLLQKYMNGTTTLAEEEVLSKYFRQKDVPDEWRDYQLLFAEIDAMKPQSAPKSFRLRPLRWAAAIVIGVVAVAVSLLNDSESPLASDAVIEEKTDTMIEERHVQKAVEMPTDSPVIKHQMPRKQQDKRPRYRKREPTIYDYDKPYIVMARMEAEKQEAERQIRQAQLDILHARLKAAGYVAVQEEDGSITYIEESKDFFAYEE